MSKVRINQGRILDSGYRYLISLLLVCGMVASIIAMNNITGFILVMLLSSLMILLWTTFYITEMDTELQTYGERRSVLGRSFGRVHSYDGIEKIVINRVTFDDDPRGTAVEFDAYLKFSNGEKLFLVSDKDEKELVKRIQSVVKKLGTEIAKS